MGYLVEKCVPRQPTIEKIYGGEKFQIPFSASWCRAAPKENFTLSQTNVNNHITDLLLFIAVLALVGVVILK